MTIDHLTDDELALLNNLADCWNAFAALPQKHPADMGEFTQHIHALQVIVMARMAGRRYPSIFRGYGEELT